MRTTEGISKWYFKHRYTILFYSLLTTIAFEPIVMSALKHSPITRLLLGANLIIAVLSSMTGWMRRVLLVGAVVVWLAQLSLSRVAEPEAPMERYLVWAVIGAISAASAISFSLRAKRIVHQHLYAALSAYLLAGLVFGAIHHMVEMLVPGSYSINGEVLAGTFPIEEAIYFSFVTISTLGYGDILPRFEASRGIAMLEAVLGQLYLAVMIARIVSVYVPTRHKKVEAPKDPAD